jgi:hypothetical protein
MQSAVKEDVFLQSLALSVARNSVGPNVPISDVLVSEGLTSAEYVGIAQNPTFIQYLNKFTTQLSESGFSFEAKCKVLAEDLLSQYYHMGRDMETPAAVRSKVVENLVEWANLKPKTSAAGMAAGSGFSINIVLPGTQEPATTVVVNAQPDPENSPVILDGDIHETSTLHEQLNPYEENALQHVDPEPVPVPITVIPLEIEAVEEQPVDNSGDKVVEFANWIDDMLEEPDPEYTESE